MNTLNNNDDLLTIEIYKYMLKYVNKKKFILNIFL